ncbi:MAG: hypothetical protein P8173_02455 [Gammaproteobacteria bacterium]|jgi:hypothetical protein
MFDLWRGIAAWAGTVQSQNRDTGKFLFKAGRSMAQEGGNKDLRLDPRFPDGFFRQQRLWYGKIQLCNRVAYAGSSSPDM